MEVMLYSMAKDNLESVLEFLLKKAKEWTNIARDSLS